MKLHQVKAANIHKEKALLECITRMESLISALAKEHVALKGRVVASQEDGHDVNKGGKKLKPIKNQKGSAYDSNGSKAANIELANMTDDNRPLAPSGQSVENTTKHVDVVETPPTEVQTELQLNRLQLHSNEQAIIQLKWVEVRTEVDNLGDVWSEAQVIKENEDGTLLVKLWRFDTEESFPYSKIRPSRPYSFRSETFNLMDKVDAHLEYKC